MSDKTFKAHKVANEINRIQENTSSPIEGLDLTVKQYMECVVENGTFLPNAAVVSQLSLTPKERITGTRKQDMTAVMALGMMLGAALERDIPKDSALEDAWRDGAFELPDDYE